MSKRERNAARPSPREHAKDVQAKINKAMPAAAIRTADEIAQPAPRAAERDPSENDGHEADARDIETLRAEVEAEEEELPPGSGHGMRSADSDEGPDRPAAGATATAQADPRPIVIVDKGTVILGVTAASSASNATATTIPASAIKGAPAGSVSDGQQIANVALGGVASLPWEEARAAYVAVRERIAAAEHLVRVAQGELPDVEGDLCRSMRAHCKLLHYCDKVYKARARPGTDASARRALMLTEVKA